MAAPPRPPRVAGFTGGGVAGHLWRLGSFMALGSVALNAAQVGEAVFLGMVGTEALAAMGFAFPITITLFAFAGGIGTGASSVIARAMGAGDRERGAVLATHAQLLGFLVGVALGILGALFAADIVTALGATGVVREMTIAYLHVYMLGVPFFLLSIVGSTLLRATGRAASPGIVMAVGSILQVLFCPFLIFGWLGLPALGIEGAAWAYVASRVISVWVYMLVMSRARILRRSLAGLWDSWRAILHVGGPAIASGLINPVSMLIVTRLLAGHGHEVVAGFNVAARVEMLAHMILWSASSSIEPFVGQNWGGRRFDRVRSALRITEGFCVVWGLFTFTVLALSGEFLVSLIDDNAVVVAVAVAFFLIVAPSIGGMGVMQVAIACFNARGKPMPALTISVVRTFVFYVPLCVVGNALWGYIGIFVATALTNVVMGVAGWYWNRASVMRFVARQAEA